MLPAGVGTVLATLSLVTPVAAENLQLVQKLLSTRQCPRCDLSNAGLVFADLAKANLSGADLSGANLSRANLKGANLQGADLSGASLAGANLVGANLDGAKLTGTDLRSAYLMNASFEGTQLDATLLEGAIGLSTSVGQAEDFYRWAMEDGLRKNLPGAIENFTQAISRNPDFAQAYLGRGVARFQLGDRAGAIADSRMAEQLFEKQDNQDGMKVAQKFATELETPASKKQGMSFAQNLLNVVGGLVQMFLLK
jgi:uncharacterized protein YjbI with pentapeptide repeats